MKLDLISYCEDENLPSEWRLEDCRLGDINLIVGKNASGKTRILRSINFLADLLSGKESLSEDPKYRNWELTFDANTNKKKIYKLRANQGRILKEQYDEGQKTYLTRGDSVEGKIWADELQRDINFQVPTEELAALKKRDSIQHRFLEEIHNWAISLRYYRFGSSLGKPLLPLVDGFPQKIDPKNTHQVVDIFNSGKERFGQPFIENIKLDMSVVGYNISDINIQKAFVSPRTSLPYICVQENDLKVPTEQSLISQGMFRTLSLIIQINYSLKSSQSSCILIDDIGEGLDFERSQAMIKLVINKARTGLVQLIMTTNNRFIMNGVPLEYWSVIQRKPGLAKLYHINNSPKIFADFKFTGLNNFDFFATDFYLEGFGQEEIRLLT
jgi:AAA15 family ATPase/GTPase